MKNTDILNTLKYQLATETIAFQPKHFGLELEALFSDILAQTYSGVQLQEMFAKRANEIVKKFTNLKINTNFNTTGGPQASCLNLTNDNALQPFHKRHTNASARYFTEQLKINSKENTVNTRTARVTGFFAEYESTISMPYAFIYGFKLNAQELAGVFLHEIGHVFTTYEYTNRFSTINQVLAIVLRSNRVDTLEEKSYVFKQISDVISTESNLLEDLENISDEKAITTVVINRVYGVTMSQTNSLGYDYSSSEVVADQFSARFGYGRALVTAMEKTGASSYLDKYKSARLAASICHMLYTALVGAAAVVSPLTYRADTIKYVWTLFMTLTFGSGEANKATAYDNARVRYLRLREQLVQKIKDKELDPEEIKITLNDISIIDGITETMLGTEHRNMFGIMLDYFSPRHASARDARLLQRRLEEFASNSLFVKSAKLATM